MKVVLKNKLVSFGGSSFVRDEAGNDVFKVKGRCIFFSPTKKKKIVNMEKQTLYKVRNKFWHIWYNSVFIFDAEGNKIGRLRSEKTFSRTFRLLESNIDVKMVFDNNEWTVYRNDEPIGKIYRHMTIIRDAFTVESLRDEDIALVVTMAVAFDNLVDNIFDL